MEDTVSSLIPGSSDKPSGAYNDRAILRKAFTDAMESIFMSVVFESPQVLLNISLNKWSGD